MVTEQDVQPVGIEDEVAVSDADLDLEDSQPEQNETQEEFDARKAIDEMRAQFAEFTQRIDPSKVNSVLGRVSSIQSTLDKLSKQNKPEDDTRIARLEEQIDMLLGTIAGVDILDDASRDRLREFKDKRDEEKREARIIERLRAESQPAEPDPEAAFLAAQWQKYQAKLVAYANTKGIDPMAIPANVIAEANQTGDPVDGYEVVKAWIDSQGSAPREEDKSAERVATRREAAGRGAPARAGATRSIEEIEQVYGSGGSVSEDELKRLKEYLGIPV